MAGALAKRVAHRGQDRGGGQGGDLVGGWGGGGWGGGGWGGGGAGQDFDVRQGKAAGEVQIAKAVGQQRPGFGVNRNFFGQGKAMAARDGGGDVGGARGKGDAADRHQHMAGVGIDQNFDLHRRRSTDLGHLLLEEAQLAAGDQLADPAAFIARVNRIALDG